VAHFASTTQLHETERARRATRRLLLVGIPLFWSSWYVYNAYLSVYARSLGASLSLVGIIVGAYGFTQLVLRIPIGVVSDRLGRRKPFVLLGTIIGALSCAVMLIAPQPWVLIVGRGLAGIGAGCWVPLSVLLVASYPKSEVIKATSMASALSGVGTTLASALGGQLAEATNVRFPFWVGIGLGVAAMGLLAFIREPERAAREPVPVSALLSVGKVPMVLVVSILALLSQYISWAMTQGFVPIYAADLGANKAQLGLMMSVWQGSNTLVSFGAGHLNARLGSRWTVVLGSVLVTLSTLLVPLIRGVTPLILTRALQGVGQGIAFPVLMGSALLAVSEERRGAAMGFFQAIYAIGMVAGPAVSGVFADHLGLIPTFYVTSALSFVSVVVAMTFLPHRVRAAEASRPS
jgi:MFS family permease